MQIKKHIFLALCWMLLFSGVKAQESFFDRLESFVAGYAALHIPDFTFDYREYFRSIPSEEGLQKQREFFAHQEQEIKSYPGNVTGRDLLNFKQIIYEISLNRQRLALEEKWIKGGRNIPEGGLHGLEDHAEWYGYFIKKFTSLDLRPEDVMKFGISEVQRVQGEINAIRKSQGFRDSSTFYSFLQKSNFYSTNKDSVLLAFTEIDSTVRMHLMSFIGAASIPPVYAMEWPGAGPNTPPGIYLNRKNTAYGKDVFQYNFYDGRYNKRSMEWLYMHEAIPGHHLQYSLSLHPGVQSPMDSLFVYPGNFEGWGCYVEYFGKDLGLYTDPFNYLGKWEWDLVRSARLVLDAGIHFYGWSHDEALQYWKSVIPGQDAIAEREITRVTNWPGQALSYKIGAEFIFKLKADWQKAHPHQPVAAFHHAYLECGRLPLPVIRQSLLDKP